LRTANYIQTGSLALILFSALLSFSGYSQRIKNFTLLQNGTSVTVRFTLAAGSMCNGYSVQRSLDSLSYTDIVDNPAICGTSGADEPKTETDAHPVMNQYNYYKIRLGTGELSEARKIFLSQDGRLPVTVFPNPSFNINDLVKVRIPGVFNTRLQGYIYDGDGHPKEFVDFITNGDMAPIQTGSYINGLYLVWLTDGYQAYTGKFIIRR
jgi:hypothetical protein